MACIPFPGNEALPAPAPRAMTRCECTETPFAEAAREMEAQKLTFDDYMKKTGCGGNCTACVPDLKRFLASQKR